ncbi:oligosaccharyl transferase, archaeosortase A system-associated [Natrialbaceae archaeon AArc-T1-2]|uniref:oligosaccharyl transferase, archaeosortase A system-associated n=1 Tax=Natrialbaceae archaeon AArc-T1-2 TaxID=3053904 RepID=UPI00255A829C|nr:oligosaccharyl transferase, archaeosortase A system-associated [Natrialbaceae archaeon AArc-T1-2]WIV66359.1 oligosaccharyl transferase, archaeosortase A system-associated [Natrialbaceae archaeon AArc-T1-2]
MSTDTERLEEDVEATFLERWDEWYHIPVLGVVILFMFLARIRAYDRFAMEEGAPALAAVDSWYHWRTVQWTAENFPYTMPYEVWTSFPDGRYVGQFGTLFDQLIVIAAMIVGLGDPSTETLYTVALLAVPVMGALVAIPVFYMGRRLGGTIGGIVSIVLLALAPGTFFYRTTTGQLQHHVAEVLFMAIAVLAMMAALRVAEREKPIWELVADKDVDALREPALYSVLAGIALTLYIWSWPPGVVLIGIFGVFFAVQLCLDYVRGVSPDHVAFVGAISLGLTAVLTALLIEEPGTSVTSFGYLQPVSAALVAVGSVFMAWLARQWNEYGADRRYYPVAIGGLVVVAFGLMALVLPDFYSTFVSNLQGRVLPIGERGAGLTIAEAQPPPDYTGHVFEEFGTAFYTMLAGLAFLVARPFFGREYRAEYTLVVVWSLFLISMSMTQMRFAYYLVLAVAIVNAVFVADVVRLFDLDVDLRSGYESLREVEAYQIIVLVMVVMLLFAPLLPPVAASGDTAWERGNHVGPSEDATTWEEATHWLNANTPEPGDWGEEENADRLEYYGSYDYPEDGSYDYPPGTYGVLSWWDYGHLITVQGERIPHSNPFQSNARSSAAFFTAQDEGQGELYLDAVAAGESPDHEADEAALEAAVAESDLEEELRYVMIDHEMAGGKFSAITEWTGPEYETYVEQREYQGEPVPASSEAYHDTMLASLYLEDASELEHYRLVHENDDYAVVGGMVNPRTGMPTAQYSLPFRHLGLESAWGNETQGVQSALEQAEADDELFQQLGIPIWDGEVISTVKTFERVEGAALTGTVDPDEIDENATVTAMVELETAPGRTFVYEQTGELEDDGSFELTVPYATDDELGVDDGYTDSSVEATGEYTIVVDGDEQQLVDETAVSETDVVEGESVSIEPEEIDIVDAPEEGDGDGGTEAGDDDEDDGAAEDDDDEDDGGTDVAESIAG